MTNKSIHPTAIISPQAELGDNVSVDAYAIIEDHVQIGNDCQIHAHAKICAYTKMGTANQIHSFASVGSAPQDLSFDPKTVSWLEMGDHNDVRESAVLSRATVENGATRIGSHCFFMNNTHIAHDCRIDDHCIFASNAAVAGHVHVGHNVFVGAGAMGHQFMRIGAYAMVSGMLGLRKDVLPFSMIGGEPILHYRLNTVGLRRAGIVGENYQALSKAFRLLRNRKDIGSLPDTKEIEMLKGWLASESKRGIYGFVRPGFVRPGSVGPKGKAEE